MTDRPREHSHSREDPCDGTCPVGRWRLSEPEVALDETTFAMQPEPSRHRHVSHTELMRELDRLAHLTDEDMDLIALRARRKVEAEMREHRGAILPATLMRGTFADGWSEIAR